MGCKKAYIYLEGVAEVWKEVDARFLSSMNEALACICHTACCSISELIYIARKSISYLRSPRLITEAVVITVSGKSRQDKNLLLTKPRKLESLLFLAS